MRRILPISFLAALAACAAQGPLFVSKEAVSVGGNLYLEPVESEDGLYAMVLDGEITPATPVFLNYFIAEADEVSGLNIAQSPGGPIASSQQMGRDIRRNGLNTIVYGWCISACVDVFIAGKERVIARGAVLGLHGTRSQRLNRRVFAAYWNEMGFAQVGERAIAIPNDALWEISAEEALRLGLATEIID